MGSMGRPIQPKKILNHVSNNKSSIPKPAPGAGRLGEIKRVCAKCGHIWMAKNNPFGPIACPTCKTIITK